MSTAKRILAALLCAVILFFAAVRLPAPEINKKHEEELPPASISMLYRDAVGILLCECVYCFPESESTPKSLFMVKEVLEGNIEKDKLITLPCAAVLNADYLLYLAKDEFGTRLLTGQPIPVEEGAVTYENESCSYESVVRDIERQQRILTVPSQSFYYGELEGLVSACDEIAACRVVSVSEPAETVCRSGDKGESTLFTMELVFVSLSVETSFSGALSRGDTLELALPHISAIPVINARDLSPKNADIPEDMRLTAGSTYIFFLLRSGDPKNPRYFVVNPCEGCVPMHGETLTPPEYNEAFSGINEVSELVKRMRELSKAQED